MLPVFSALLLAVSHAPAQPVENGYDDYIRATEVISDPAFSAYISWTPQQYEQMLESEKADAEYLAKLTPKERAEFEKIDPDMFKPSVPTPEETARRRLLESLRGQDYVSVNRSLSVKYARALYWIRQGNSKPYFDPRGKITASTLFPELAKFKSLTKLATADAYVKFADGDSAGGVRTLLDAMTFARRVERGRTLIENLVGIAMSAIVTASFNENLNALSLTDCATIAKYTDGAIRQDPGLIQVLQAERQFAVDSLDEILENPAAFLTGDSDDDKTFEFTKRWGKAEMDGMRAAFQRTLDARFETVIAPLRKPESGWYPSYPKEAETEEPMLRGTTPEEVGRMIAETTAPIYRQWIVAVSKSRAQLRMLGLHARINAYRWKYKKLPLLLEDAASPKDAFDPFSNQEFAYELGDGSYRLFSRGRPETGPIALRYRKEAKEDAEEAAP